MHLNCRPAGRILTTAALAAGLFADPAAAAPATRGRAYISGLVYLDVNRNGWRDAREPGIPDLPIEVDGGIRVLTDRTGGFTVRGLREGVHRLSIEQSEIPVEFRPLRKLSREVHAAADPGLPLEIRLSWRPTPPKIVLVSSTTVEPTPGDERPRALVAIEQVERKLGRLKSSGYQVLVQEAVTRAEAALREARLSLDGGDAASALHIAEAWSGAVEEARRQIESQTRQSIRW